MKTKKLFMLLIAAATAFSLAACGGDTQNNAMPENSTAAESSKDDTYKTSGDWQYIVSRSDGGIWITQYQGSKSEVEIPEKIDGTSVTTIGAAFYANKTIKKVTIPDGVEEIAFECFAESSIKEVVIPAGVKKIETGAFSKCDNLTDIYYEGSEDQWNSIDIGNSNESLSNAAIHYNEN